ncbi:MAG: hypothetical protein RIR41_1627 [Pseudomonadota bacterium]|jgi:hypothetical protein
MATNTLDWQPMRQLTRSDAGAPIFWADRAFDIVDGWLGDFGMALGGQPDAFAQEDHDRFAFRFDSCGKSVAVRAQVSWQDAPDGRDYAVRVEITSPDAHDVHAELAAEKERAADWRAKAAEFRIERDEAITRAEAAEAELREIKKVRT